MASHCPTFWSFYQIRNVQTSFELSVVFSFGYQVVHMVAHYSGLIWKSLNNIWAFSLSQSPVLKQRLADSSIEYCKTVQQKKYGYRNVRYSSKRTPRLFTAFEGMINHCHLIKLNQLTIFFCRDTHWPPSPYIINWPWLKVVPGLNNKSYSFVLIEPLFIADHPIFDFVKTVDDFTLYVRQIMKKVLNSMRVVSI